MEQDKIAKQNNNIPKSSVLTHPVAKPSTQQPLENSSIPNKRKRDGEKKPWHWRNCGKEHFRKCFELSKCSNCMKVGNMKNECPKQTKEEEEGMT